MLDEFYYSFKPFIILLSFQSLNYSGDEKYSFMKCIRSCLDDKINCCKPLTLGLSEDKCANFGQVDHLCPHKAGDCVFVFKGDIKIFLQSLLY